MLKGLIIFSFSKINVIRYEKAIIKSMHNHMRIERILASLSITGFRKYAKELVKFL